MPGSCTKGYKKTSITLKNSFYKQDNVNNSYRVNFSNFKLTHYKQFINSNSTSGSFKKTSSLNLQKTTKLTMKMGNTTNNNNCKKSPSNKAQERHRLILKTPLHLTPFIVHYRLRILIASSKSKHKTLKTNGSNIKLGNYYLIIFSASITRIVKNL